MSATAASVAITAIQNPAAVSIIDRGGAVCGSSWYGVQVGQELRPLVTSFHSHVTGTAKEGSQAEC